MTAQAMMRPKFKRPRNWGRQADNALKDFRAVVSQRLIVGLTDMQNSILETPVYTGRTLINFRWSIGAPNTTTRAAIAEPNLPGKTSDLPLGSEPRRAANAAVIEEEFLHIIAAVKENPFQSIFLNNNLSHYSEVEYGTYARDGHESRTPPSGITRRGETLLEYSTGGLLKRVA